jgi:tRNA modification GTPase
MSAPTDNATYLARLTPPGTAAIATLAVRGPDAWDMIRDLFQPGARSPLPEVPDAGRFWLGRLGEPSRGGADQVVLAVARAAPVPWLEVHCHGGLEVLRLLEEAFTARGARICSWQDLERQTGDNALRAEALAALAEAPTARTAAVVLDQYHGAFDRAVTAVVAALERQDPAAGCLLDELARHVALGRHLAVPWRVVLAGAPNVGKSSLVNALAGYQRSVVAPTPGTTRDVVTVRLAVDGWPVELADTAGWRDAGESLEQQGVARARTAAAGADLCLWVLDAAAVPSGPPEGLGPVRSVINKIDRPAAWDLEQAPAAVRVSALTGAGLDALQEALSRWLVPDQPSAGAAVPFTPLLAERVEEARRHAQAGEWAQTLRVLASVRAERR